MSFHNVELPETIRYGSVSGYGFSTLIQASSSGHEMRNARQAQARHRFAPIKTLQTQEEALALKAFGLGRRGSLHSWRLKDWLDFTSNADGQSPPNVLDQIIATGDGVSNRWQLLKTYDLAEVGEYVRTITLPELASVLVAVDGVPTLGFQVSGAGLLHLSDPPPAGAIVTAGYEFRVPVRFEREVDQFARLQADAFRTWSAGDLSCVETLDEVEYPERWNAGGGRDWPGIAQDFSVGFNDGQLQYVSPTVAVNMFLPPAAYHPGGNEVFAVSVAVGSAGTVQVRADDGTAVGPAIVAGSTRVLALARTGSSYVWIMH